MRQAVEESRDAHRELWKLLHAKLPDAAYTEILSVFGYVSSKSVVRLEHALGMMEANVKEVVEVEPEPPFELTDADLAKFRKAVRYASSLKRKPDYVAEANADVAFTLAQVIRREMPTLTRKVMNELYEGNVLRPRWSGESEDEGRLNRQYRQKLMREWGL